MPTFNEVFGGLGQGAEDVARAGIADVGNTYVEQFLKGRTAPTTPLTGDMEITTGPEEVEPQSYGAALREYSDNEQADIRAGHEAEQAQATPVQESTSYEPEV